MPYRANSKAHIAGGAPNMAIKKVTRPPAPKPTVVKPPTSPVTTLPLTGANPGLVSPYDGTSPVPGMGIMSDPTGGLLGSSGRPVPQVNANSQNALATNGDINQTVSNENTYKNVYNYYVASPYGYGGVYNSAYSGWGTGYGQQLGMPGAGGFNGNYNVDPYTGALVYKQRGGVIGWLQRLFRGY